MSLLDQLWDDTVAGPCPDSGLGKLRKRSTSFGFRSNNSSKEEILMDRNAARSVGENVSEDNEVRVTRSIMILKQPPQIGDQTAAGGGCTPPASPAAGSTPPVSPLSGDSNGVCLSKGGRFAPYANHGKPPRTVSKGPKDLILCRIYRKKTCCDVAQTHPAFISVRKLATTGEASEDCLLLWEFLECSICDPLVGVQSGPPLICASLCDRLYDACSDAYLSMDAKIQVLAPCGMNDFVCGKISQWISNGTELCHAAGFAVKPINDIQETSCYGGKGSLDAIAEEWKSSRFNIPQEAGVLENFKQWLRETLFNEKISWAVVGMVLTAGLMFTRKKRRHQSNIQAVIQRNARIRKLDIIKNPNLPDDQANAHGR